VPLQSKKLSIAVWARASRYKRIFLVMMERCKFKGNRQKAKGSSQKAVGKRQKAKGSSQKSKVKRRLG